jgi:hypothetical protein
MMEIRPSPPTAPAPPVTPPTAVGRPIMVWGVAAGTLLAFISLLFQSFSGILVGLLIAVGAGVGGWWLTQREEETRHQRVLALLLHDPAVLVAQINASRDLDLERLRGMIKKQHIELTEPRAIRADLVRLSQSLTSLQLAAWDKSEKDPSFRAVFEQVSGMVQTTQDAVDGLLGDLVSDSSKDLTSEQQRRYEAVTKLFLDLLDKWISRL